MKTHLHERGFMLLVVYVVVICISIFAFAFFTRHSFAIQATERYQNRILAFNAAEAAVDSALTTLVQTPGWTGTNYLSFNSTSTQSGYMVTVSTPANNSNIRMISAVGYAPNNVKTSRAYQDAEITVYAKRPTQSLFQYAAFATGALNLTGNVVVDSYSSTVNGGVYDATLNSRSNDTIGTNSTTAKSINVTGSSQIHSNAVVGPNGNTATAIYLGGTSKIWGTTTAATTAQTYVAMTTTVAASPDPSLTGIKTLTLPAGTYHYTALTIANSGKLTTTGQVNIYVDGVVSLSGAGIVNQGNIPSNLTIYETGNSAVSILNSGVFYGGIYAPNSTITNSGDVNIYGAIICKTMTLSNSSKIHYYEDMASGSGSSSQKFSITTWQELNSLAWGMGS